KEDCDWLAQVFDANGEDGCGFYFKLRDGRVVFPTNESEFPFRLREGMHVYTSFKYDSRQYTCTIIRPVYVTCISEVLNENRPQFDRVED
ncbi:MAG: hypothetical protein AAF206_09240, partial [Bacteroidota bacterium]